MCIPDLVITKYFGINTIEIKQIVFTYLDLLPSALFAELELIHEYHMVGICLLWESCNVRPVSMASWNRGICFPGRIGFGLLLLYNMDVSCHRPFLPGTSLEPVVIRTGQASSFTLQYFPYYV